MSYLPFAPAYADLDDNGDFVAEWFLPGCRILLSSNEEETFFCVIGDVDHLGYILDVEKENG